MKTWDKNNLIKQRNSMDCGVCCLAMASGLPYETVVKKLGDLYNTENGLYTAPSAFTRVGLKVELVKDVETFVPALVTFGDGTLVGGVPLGHMCYWTGEELLDPAWGIKEWDEILQVWRLN